MKQKLFLFWILLALIISFQSACTKDYLAPNGGGVTALNIVNAIPEADPLIANINDQLPYYNGQVNISSGNYRLYRFSGGTTGILFRPVTDTVNNFFTTAGLDLPNNSVHSLFLSGSLASPEAILITDNLPKHTINEHGQPDSTAGIRFINLSPGSNAVSINIEGQANGSEISSLDYKTITEFRNYSAVSTVSDYIFEFRDASTGDLLTTYTLSGVNNGSNGNTSLNSVRFKNMTIVLNGLPGAQSAFLVKNY